MRLSMRFFKLGTLLSLMAVLSMHASAAPPDGKGGGKDKGGGGDSTQPTYTFTWLGTFGGEHALPGGINDSGDIWGSSTNTSGDNAPFIIWASGPQAGLMLDFQQQLIAEGWIDPFDWSTLTGVIEVSISEINDLGHIAFIADEILDVDTGDWLYHTYLYKPATVDDDGNSVPASLQLVNTDSRPVYEARLNNADVVASDSSQGTYQWSESTGLDYLSSTQREVWGLNLGGSMCGAYGGWKYTPDLGFCSPFPANITGYRQSLRDINDLNQIAGVYQRSDLSDFYACRIEGDDSITVISMPKKLASVGYAINKFGDVVGSGNLNGGWRPFVYTDSDGIIDVFSQTVNLPLELATIIDGNGMSDRIGHFDINDAGQIVGSVILYSNDGNYVSSFLLTPNP